MEDEWELRTWMETYHYDNLFFVYSLLALFFLTDNISHKSCRIVMCHITHFYVCSANGVVVVIIVREVVKSWKITFLISFGKSWWTIKREIMKLCRWLVLACCLGSNNRTLIKSQEDFHHLCKKSAFFEIKNWNFLVFFSLSTSNTLRRKEENEKNGEMSRNEKCVYVLKQQQWL